MSLSRGCKELLIFPAVLLLCWSIKFAAMKINNIQVWDFQPPFRDGPYEMSGVSQRTAYGRILKITMDTGITRLGEVVLSHYLSLEEMQSLIDEEEVIFKPLEPALTCT